MSYLVLFVDDDKSILKSIRRELMDTDFDSFFVESGEEALNFLKDNKVDIIVSDMMMPNMDGTELLKNVKRLYPHIVKVVLSGYADQKMIFKLINSNLAKAFINKPWKENELEDTIHDIIKINDKLNNANLKEIINSSNKLPDLTSVYNKISNLIEDETSEVDDIIKLINTDQVIASKILRVVNSAFYGVKTGSIKAAVLNLGLVNLKSIIITSQVFDLKDGYYENLLWKHSSLTNILTIKLYEHIYKNRIPDIYATAGLLHDIGKVVLLKIFDRQYNKVISMKEDNSEIILSAIEKSTFDFNHEEIGSILLNYWELPASIVEVALNHHNPEESSKQFKEIVCLVHLADYYSWKYLNTKFVTQVKEEAFDYLGVTESDINDFLKNKTFEV
ncbi:HDOD domain-containing protein [Clostridium estertheticum]|uniref:HDOD domain-containing protein n=1 Tax=Clostridium estertheticum TaxID=238834 RepID=UPI001C0B2570|nr:HDOD domain-containing protein [Clostridium estertheticum]MBU3187187.1 HDOD domain-containing protein [Clostridium estertheticum]